MSAFLTELADQLADKWLTLIVVPGLLFVATAVAGGHFLGQAHWADWTRLYDRISALSTSKSLHSQVVIGVLAVAVLAGSAASGLLVRGLGLVVGRLWMGTWPAVLARPSRRLTRYRQSRWTTANVAWNQTTETQALRKLAIERGEAPAGMEPYLDSVRAKRNAIGLQPPQRPTWIGDRLLAADGRVWRAYGMDLTFCWPRLWMIMSDTDRAGLTAAQTAYNGASRLTGWGLLYIGLGLWWWPSAVVGLAVVFAGVVRGRAGAGGYADLLESAVVLHGMDLAHSLGLGRQGPLTVAIGAAVTARLQKDA